MPFKSKKSTEEKLAVVLEGLKGETTVGEICRKYGLSQAVYYKWRDKFLEGGKKALEQNVQELGQSKQDKSKIEELEKVIGRQTIEIQVLKKNLNLS
jgi:transposase-like protein